MNHTPLHQRLTWLFFFCVAGSLVTATLGALLPDAEWLRPDLTLLLGISVIGTLVVGVLAVIVWLLSGH